MFMCTLVLIDTINLCFTAFMALNKKNNRPGRKLMTVYFLTNEGAQPSISRKRPSVVIIQRDTQNVNCFAYSVLIFKLKEVAGGVVEAAVFLS